MPPLLALALCTAVVIVLLRLDRKQAPEVTGALWVPTVWMLYVASKPLGIWFQAVRTDPDAGSPMDQVFLTVIMVFALVILARRRSRWAGGLSNNPWLIALVVFMLVSTIWSSIPVISLKRWIRELQAVLMALVVLSEESPRQALESVLRRTPYILIPFSLILIKYFPTYGVEYGRWSGDQMWIGVAQQKNGLATVCIISAVYLLWSLFRRWQKQGPAAWKHQTHVELLILLLTFYLLGGPRHSLFYSATSAYALLAGLACCSWVYLGERSGRRVKAGSLLAVMSILMILGIASVFVGGSGIKLFASTAGRDATLTGRTGVWTSLLPEFMASPVAGRGYGGFWTSETRERFMISGAHSGYLDVLLGIGLIGLILSALFLLSSCRKARQELPHDLPWGLLWICYLIMSAVHNITESSLDSLTTPLTAVLVFLAVSSTRLLPAERRPPEGHSEVEHVAGDPGGKKTETS